MEAWDTKRPLTLWGNNTTRFMRHDQYAPSTLIFIMAPSKGWGDYIPGLKQTHSAFKPAHLKLRQFILHQVETRRT